MSDTFTKLISSDNLLLGTLLPFLAILTLVVFVHEMGHYLVGRWCGIGVKAFSVGFGRELIGFTTGAELGGNCLQSRLVVMSSLRVTRTVLQFPISKRLKKCHLKSGGMRSRLSLCGNGP